MKSNIWSVPLLKSRTDCTRVGLWEMALGYFLGPLCVLVMTTVVSTYYLTFYRSYDDIVSQGAFLALLPLLSVIPMALSNILIGILVGKTRTVQGKARPYILAAGPLLLISGILVFCIPYLSLGARMIWIVISFNLFASLANPLYGTSHYLMVSLSTRDLKQRGKLSVIANIPAVAANGLVGSIVMPLVLNWIRAAGNPGSIQNRWQLVMTLFSIIAFLGCILEYLFTRERITEEDPVRGQTQAAGDSEAETEKKTETETEIRTQKVPAAVQLKAAASDKFWWIIMVFYMLYQAGVMFKGGYVFNIYCNEFFDRVQVFGILMTAEQVQSVLALISGIPLAAGMLFIWPLADKFGKKNMIVAGLAVSIIGSLICISAPDNFAAVLAGQTFKGFSSVPGAYIMMALFADVLDHLEARFGFRADGVSMSVYNTIITVVNGLAVAVFTFFYDSAFFTPSEVAVFFFLGFEIFAHGALIAVMCCLSVEKDIVKEQELIARRKAGNHEM